MKAFPLSGTPLVKEFTTKLIDASIYFTVTPLPNDIYEVSVKEDVAHVASRILKQVRTR